MQVLPFPPLGVEAEGAQDDEGDEGDNAGKDKLAGGAGPELSANG